MTTSQKQISLFTEEQLTSLQEASPASPTAPQESASEKTMSATYGLKCLEQYEKFNRVGLLAKMFPALLIGRGGVVFEEVQTELEAEGYEVLAFVLPAAGVGAPHRRDRVWFVAYSNNSRGSTGLGQVQGEDEKVPEWYNNAELSDAGCDGVAANTPSNRRQRERQRIALEKGLQSRSESAWQLAGRLERFCHAGDATHSSNARLQRSKEQGGAGGIRQESHQQPAGCVCTAWDEFPTQSPVCSRDDGFSPKLDGITFSKWRSESVKAYGNAIVPQVALQIFLTINEFESSIKK